MIHFVFTLHMQTKLVFTIHCLHVMSLKQNCDILTINSLLRTLNLPNKLTWLVMFVLFVCMVVCFFVCLWWCLFCFFVFVFVFFFLWLCVYLFYVCPMFVCLFVIFIRMDSLFITISFKSGHLHAITDWWKCISHVYRPVLPTPQVLSDTFCRI